MAVRGRGQLALADTGTASNVSASASSVTLKAANADRVGLIVHNDSSATLYLKYGATASTTSYTYKVGPDDHWVMESTVYTGVVDGIWDSATGAARVTEIT